MARAEGSVSFMIACWKSVAEHLEAERLRHVAEDRLARRDLRAGEALADRRDLLIQFLKRGGVVLEPTLVFGRALRVGRRQRRGERAGERGHGARVVPEMRVAAFLGADERARHR